MNVSANLLTFHFFDECLIKFPRFLLLILRGECYQFLHSRDYYHCNLHLSVFRLLGCPPTLVLLLFFGERSVPPITLRKICERSVPPITLRKNSRAFRSSHHPPTKIASVPFLPSPFEKICERSVPPITLLKKLRAFRSSHHPFTKLASVPFLPSPFLQNLRAFRSSHHLPITLLHILRAFRPSHQHPTKFVGVPFLSSPS